MKCVSARGLRDADWLEGTSDPYCLCESIGKVGTSPNKKSAKGPESTEGQIQVQDEDGEEQREPCFPLSVLR